MTIDERVRDAMHAYADPIDPEPDSWTQISARLDDPVAPSRASARRRLALAGLALGLVMVLVAALLVRDQDTTKTRVATGPVDMPKQVVALTTSLDLVVLDSTTGALVRTLAHDVSVSRGLPELAPTPDGKSVYFTSYLPPDPTCPSAGSVDALLGVDIEGGTVGLFGTGQSVAISPDGRWLATAGGRGIACSAQPFLGISLRDLRTGQTRIVSSTAGTIEKLSWSPDSRDLAFQWSNDDGSYAYVLDAATAGSVDEARCLCGQLDGTRWFGYLGARGFLGTSQINGDALDGGASVFGPDGAPQEQLFPFDGTIDFLVSDVTGTRVLVTGGQMKNRVQVDDLYRWSWGDPRPTKIADRIVGAAWIPDASTTTPVPGPADAPNGIVAVRNNELVVLDAQDGQQHSSLGTVADGTIVAPTTDGRTLLLGASAPPAQCDSAAPVTPPVLEEMNTVDGSREPLVGAAYSPAMSRNDVVAYGYACDGNGLGLTDVGTGKNFRFDAILRRSGASSTEPVSIHPLGWSPDGRRLLYFVSGRGVPRLVATRFAPAFFTAARPRDTDSVEIRAPKVRTATMSGDDTIAAVLPSAPRRVVEYRLGETLTEPQRLFEMPSPVTSIVVDPTGQHFLIVSGSGELWRWSRGQRGPAPVATGVTAAAWIPWS